MAGLVLATISLVIIGVNIGKLASKISVAGSFFIYVSRGLEHNMETGDFGLQKT